LLEVKYVGTIPIKVQLDGNDNELVRVAVLAINKDTCEYNPDDGTLLQVKEYEELFVNDTYSLLSKNEQVIQLVEDVVRVAYGVLTI
jgi:hypothetical protein